VITKQFDIPSNCRRGLGALATDPAQDSGDAALGNRPRGGSDIRKQPEPATSPWPPVDATTPATRDHRTGTDRLTCAHVPSTSLNLDGRYTGTFKLTLG
jgi:hypothetical protein